MKCPLYSITDKPTYTCIAKCIFKYSHENIMEFCVPKRQCTTYLRCSRRMECNSYERMIYKHLKKFTGLHTGRLHGNLFSAYHIFPVYSDKLHINLGQCFALCVQEQNHSLHLHSLVGHCTITSSIIMLMLTCVRLWYALLALARAFPPLSMFWCSNVTSHSCKVHIFVPYFCNIPLIIHED